MTMAALELRHRARGRFLSFTFLLVLATAAATLGIRPARADVGAADVAAQSNRVQRAEALLTHARGASSSLVQLLVAEDRETRVPLYRQIDAANAAADEALAALVQEARTADERSRAEGLQAHRARYDELYTAAVEEIELNGAQGALAQFWSATREALVRLEDAASVYVKHERSRLDEQKAALAAAEKSQMTLLLVVAAVVGAAIVGWLMLRSARQRASDAKVG